MTTSAAPVLDPRVIGLAHYAGRAVLEHLLTPLGLTFRQLVTLRLAVVAEGPVRREVLAARAASALKVPAADVLVTVGDLAGRGLLGTEGRTVRATGAGRELYATATARTAPVSARIYAGIPAEDLAVAGRVLTRITERADAELAALQAAEPLPRP